MGIDWEGILGAGGEELEDAWQARVAAADEYRPEDDYRQADLPPTQTPTPTPQTPTQAPAAQASAPHGRSKPLAAPDTSGFDFVKESLCGDSTFAINFDRLQKHPERGYILFEFLLCGEGQRVTPHTSHPRRYWHRNSQKFLSLFEVAQALDAELYLVNYAKAGTAHADEVTVIEVRGMNTAGITDERVMRLTRSGFSDWFRALNAECA